MASKQEKVACVNKTVGIIMHNENICWGHYHHYYHHHQGTLMLFEVTKGIKLGLFGISYEKSEWFYNNQGWVCSLAVNTKAVLGMKFEIQTNFGQQNRIWDFGWCWPVFFE